MSTIRTFTGTRTGGKHSIAGELLRFELRKKGKLPPAERYKRIMKKRLEESRKKALEGRVKNSKLPGSLSEARQMSKKAEEALKQMAAKKAAKEAKAERQMVIIQPRNFSNGSLNRKGQIYDVAGNVVGTVSRKNGAMVTGTGWKFGQYKPNSYSTNVNIQNAIYTYSPYYINLRKMQAMQQGMDVGGYDQDVQHHVINHYGYAGSSPLVAPVSTADENAAALRGGGVTAWGFMADNTWGVFSDNVWGTISDNVWGTCYTNVWGGVADAGGWWGWKGPKVWGTGDGKNYIKGISSFFAAAFGLRLGLSGHISLHKHIAAAKSGGVGHMVAESARASGSSSGPSRGGPSSSPSRGSAAPRTTRSAPVMRSLRGH